MILIIAAAMAFPVLRMLDGCDKIPRWAMCLGMAIAYDLTTPSGDYSALALFPALLWAYSYGWSFSAVHGQDPLGDWCRKFRPSGDIVWSASKHIRNPYVLGAIAWNLRILMTFWLPCAIAGNVWAVIPLALLWGWCYWIGGVIGRLVKRDIGVRIGEGLTGLMLGVAFIGGMI